MTFIFLESIEVMQYNAKIKSGNSYFKFILYIAIKNIRYRIRPYDLQNFYGIL